ncbi:polysaccharide deacetylase family protein [Sphingomonas crocodyli]|nr:polysaccharide deacetylase family protein [Sphingomonas crocodyli]
MTVMPPAITPDDNARTRVLLTIDTELTIRTEEQPGDWIDGYARSYEAAGVGVPYQLRVLAQYALKACFFVDPMPACLYGIEPIKRMVDPILSAGQEVQLHLHPRWYGPRDGILVGEYELNSYDLNKQRDMITKARELLMEAGVPEPCAFRAGSYAANDDTLRVLAELGFRFDSSHNGSEHPWPSSIDLPREQITPVEYLGVTEVPVTLIGDGPQTRHLQVCAVSLGELEAAIRHAGAAGLPVVNIVSHSFELANRTGTAPNRVHVRRFEALCDFLSTCRDRFPTVFFSDLDEVELDVRSDMLPNSALRRFGRMVEQIWSNQVAERGA